MPPSGEALFQARDGNFNSRTNVKVDENPERGPPVITGGELAHAAT